MVFINQKHHNYLFSNGTGEEQAFIRLVAGDSLNSGKARDWRGGRIDERHAIEYSFKLVKIKSIVHQSFHQ